VCKFPNGAEEERIVSGLKWIGLLSSEPIKPKGSPVNALDTLCARLESLMKYEPGEADLVMLQHKFVVEWKDGSRVCILPSKSTRLL
jgi:spermidine synthase / saccharopine dehydrogenase (NADP+, L-glutamate-forming)